MGGDQSRTRIQVQNKTYDPLRFTHHKQTAEPLFSRMTTRDGQSSGGNDVHHKSRDNDSQSLKLESMTNVNDFI